MKTFEERLSELATESISLGRKLFVDASLRNRDVIHSMWIRDVTNNAKELVELLFPQYEKAFREALEKTVRQEG